MTEAWELGGRGLLMSSVPLFWTESPCKGSSCLWFLYLFFPCFRICFVLRFSLLFSHLILIRAFQRRWLSPCLSYRLGAEEVRGLVSTVERLQMAQLEFKPGSLALPSAETSSDVRIWTQHSLPEHSLQTRVLSTAIDSSVASHLAVSLPSRCAVHSLLGCPMVCNELSLCPEGPHLPSQGIAWTWTWIWTYYILCWANLFLYLDGISDTKFQLISFSPKDIWNFLLTHKGSLTWRHVKKQVTLDMEPRVLLSGPVLSVVTFFSHLEIL